MRAPQRAAQATRRAGRVSSGIGDPPHPPSPADSLSTARRRAIPPRTTADAGLLLLLLRPRAAVVRPSSRPLRSLREVTDRAVGLQLSVSLVALRRAAGPGELQGPGAVRYLTQRSQRAQRRTNHGYANRSASKALSTLARSVTEQLPDLGPVHQRASTTGPGRSRPRTVADVGLLLLLLRPRAVVVRSSLRPLRSLREVTDRAVVLQLSVGLVPQWRAVGQGELQGPARRTIADPSFPAMQESAQEPASDCRGRSTLT